MAGWDGAQPGPAAGTSAWPTPQAEVTEQPVTVWVLRENDGGPADSWSGVGPPDAVLVPVALSVDGGGDPGVAAVRGLLDYTAPTREFNVWADGLGRGVDLDVRSVEHDDGVVTVDFQGAISDPWPTAYIPWVVDTELFAQQLVRTVQDALDTDDPVLVTQGGEPVTSVLGARVDQPLQADDDSVASVYVTSPLGGSVFGDGRVTVTGQSNTFEATVNWRVLKGDEVVRKGFAMGRSYGEWKRFSFDVDLPPGSYTVEVFEINAEDGSRRSVNTIAVTVE